MSSIEPAPSPQYPSKRARFGVAAFGGFPAASNARAGEDVAETREHDPRRE